MDFKKFKQAVAKQFERMTGHELFRTKVDKDLLWATYLRSFPEGTDPTFRERTEHDCSCCRQFIRAVGDVVAIIDGKVVSIWDCQVDDPNYQLVADRVARYVKSLPIEDIFLHLEPKAGTDKNFEDLTEGVKTWEHFFINIPAGARGQKNFVAKGADIGGILGEARARHDTLLRALKEITTESLNTVLELISQNSLYRGEEKKTLVQSFGNLKVAFDKLSSDQAKDLYVWSQVNGPHKWVCGIRNDVIGTLMCDLSEGYDMEDAVKSFESKVAPANYKRPTALVTKAMIENAKKTVEELGITSALERRYAVITDITADNILFANRDAKKAMNGGVFDDLAPTAPTNTKNFDKVEEVSIEKFIADILPKASSIEVMFENRHSGNLVSLVAPTDPTARQLFKWPNGFSWSYNGDLADSIKERVKQAGGNVTGDVCCRLAWWNNDDLDFHMEEPGGGHIFFGSPYRADRGDHASKSPCGGQLDVDMTNGGTPQKPSVENIFYDRLSTMRDGRYRLYVNQYSKRDSNNIGFEAEVDILGTVHRFSYPKAISTGQNVEVAVFEKKGNDIRVVGNLESTQATKTVWGINTQAFHKVNIMLLSPNQWSGHSVGNKHYFFMLDGCRNDGNARGFFNEFLRGDLEQHRKVLEMVGSKMRTEESSNQLSGLGFSSTQRNSVLCKVKGSFTRTIKVTF